MYLETPALKKVLNNEIFEHIKEIIRRKLEELAGTEESEVGTRLEEV